MHDCIKEYTVGYIGIPNMFLNTFPNQAILGFLKYGIDALRLRRLWMEKNPEPKPAARLLVNPILLVGS